MALKSESDHAKSADGRGLCLVSSGVDTLNCSARGKVSEAFVQSLDVLRNGANDRREVVSCFPSDGEGFILKPHGVRGYPYWLSSGGIDLKVGAAEPFPPVLVEVRSWLLHESGVVAALNRVHRRLEADVFSGRSEVLPSRVDLQADIQGWEPAQRDLERFVCRAKHRGIYQPEAELHAYGNQLSGFAFGRGDVHGRVYNKSLEQQVSGDTGASLYWAGANLDAPVWRIEYQFRREALVGMGVGDMPALLANLQGLWHYGMGWLSLRERTAHRKRSRWPEDPTWTWLRSVEIGEPSNPLIRSRLRRANLDRVVRGLAGNLSSLAALQGTDELGWALRRAHPLVQRYVEERGESFSRIASRKRARFEALLGPTVEYE